MRSFCDRVLVLVIGLIAFACPRPEPVEAATLVRFTTDLGDFDLQLLDDVMPRTVTNFLEYVNSGRYDGTVVHRGADTFDPDLGAQREFVVQGGGFAVEDGDPFITSDPIDLDPPIDDEPGGGAAGPSNLRGTIAMAKSGPNTVTSQWYVNQGDNSVLDDPSRPDGGFSAFGRVLRDGMDVIDAIGALPIGNMSAVLGGSFGQLPLRDFTGSSESDVTVANTVTVQSAVVLNLAAGDFNRDGNVNNSDQRLLFLKFGSSDALFDDGDANMDGDVDGADFLTWQRTRGTFPTAAAAVAAVPEPSTLASAIVAASLFAAPHLSRLRRRRR